MDAYDKFIEDYKTMGLGLERALPQYFFEMEDNLVYTTEEIAANTGKSLETVRRWFRNGSLRAQYTRPYRALGIDVKRHTFRDIERNVCRLLNLS